MASKRKAPEDNPNSDFCNFLMELGDYEKNVNRNIFKYNAYRKAASVLASLPTRIESGKAAKALKGIGDKIAKKIDEFIETGNLEKLKKIRSDDTNVAINTLTRISGIGPAKAKELVDAGVTTIEQLKERCEELLNHHQRIGLKYLEDFEQKIPRKEIDDMAKMIKEQLARKDKDYEVTICGSYRRGKAESGDIDALVTNKKYGSGGSCSEHENDKNNKKSNRYLSEVVETLKDSGFITETLSMGSAKFMGVCKVRDRMRRLDIRFVPYNQYFCAILYFTGSDLFNKTMRGHALSKKFTLNEYHLRPLGETGIPGEPVTITSERDIFDYIEYPFKAPEERNM